MLHCVRRGIATNRHSVRHEMAERYNHLSLAYLNYPSFQVASLRSSGQPGAAVATRTLRLAQARLASTPVPPQAQLLAQNQRETVFAAAYNYDFGVGTFGQIFSGLNALPFQ